MQFCCDMFAERGEEAFEKTEKNLLSDHVLAYHETQTVKQEKDEREEGEQGEKCQGGCQAGAPMAQKRSDQVSENAKGLHKTRWVKGFSEA